jgi:hypothetical protein
VSKKYGKLAAVVALTLAVMLGMATGLPQAMAHTTSQRLKTLESRDELATVSASAFIDRVKARSTIQWPTNRDVREAVVSRPLAGSKAIGFLLQEYDASLPGDTVAAQMQIEHVLPQSYDQNRPWGVVFTREQHARVKDTWANLVPISAPLNASLQASKYETKRERYASESMFVTPRFVARRYTEWTPETLGARATELATWVLGRWPHTAEALSQDASGTEGAPSHVSRA